VRELANVLERAAILANGEEIGAEQLELGEVAAPAPAGGTRGRTVSMTSSGWRSSGH